MCNFIGVILFIRSIFRCCSSLNELNQPWLVSDIQMCLFNHIKHIHYGNHSKEMTKIHTKYHCSSNVETVCANTWNMSSVQSMWCMNHEAVLLCCCSFEKYIFYNPQHHISSGWYSVLWNLNGPCPGLGKLSIDSLWTFKFTPAPLPSPQEVPTLANALSLFVSTKTIFNNNQLL